MNYVDLHCDTLLEIYLQKKSLAKNDLHIDAKRLASSGCAAVCFAIHMNQRLGISDMDIFNGVYKNFLAELSSVEDTLIFAKDERSFNQALALGKIAAILAVEDGCILNDDLDNLRLLHSQGVKLLTLTWNFENCIGYPNSDDHSVMSKGLKSFGHMVVSECNRLDILIDVSHLSDGGFQDVCRLSKKPFLASHSNARTIKNHRRNMTDDMIRSMGEHGCVIGCNLYPPFVGKKITYVDYIDDCCRHIRHVRNLGGSECPAIGSDFDGFIFEDARDKNPSIIQDILHRLSGFGLNQSEIENIAYKNALRIISYTM